MKLGFYSLGSRPKGMDFGCRTLGFPDTEAAEGGSRILDREIEGLSFFGTEQQCYDFAAANHREAKAAMILTNTSGTENIWVHKLAELLQRPIVGGGAASSDGVPGEGLSEGYAQAGIFLITDKTVSVHTEFYNLHEHILEECRLELADARTIRKINGVDAACYLNYRKEQHGFSGEDFEHLTLSTLEHVNTHLRCENGIIKSGRDLQETMLLRYAMPDKVQDLMEGFYQSCGKNSIIFGCAGLKSLLKQKFSCEGLGTFLFGEICTLNGHSDFGNLMLSKIIFE